METKLAIMIILKKRKQKRRTMKESAKEISQKNISEIIPYDNNPRKNDNAVETLANSIKEFGFRQPIIIDEQNVIICGHTRLKAAKKLGLKKVPCVVATGLTPQQVKAYRLADNKIAEKSEWDMGLLDKELSSLDDINMADFGFEQSDQNEKAKLKKLDVKAPPESIVIAMSFPVSKLNDAQRVMDFAEELKPLFMENTFVYEKSNANR